MTQLIWISGAVDRVAGALVALLAAGFRRPAGFRRLDLAGVRAVFFRASCFLGFGTRRLLSANHIRAEISAARRAAVWWMSGWSGRL